MSDYLSSTSVKVTVIAVVAIVAIAIAIMVDGIKVVMVGAPKFQRWLILTLYVSSFILSTYCAGVAFLYWILGFLGLKNNRLPIAVAIIAIVFVVIRK